MSFTVEPLRLTASLKHSIWTTNKICNTYISMDDDVELHYFIIKIIKEASMFDLERF